MYRLLTPSPYPLFLHQLCPRHRGRHRDTESSVQDILTSGRRLASIHGVHSPLPAAFPYLLLLYHIDSNLSSGFRLCTLPTKTLETVIPSIHTLWTLCLGISEGVVKTEEDPDALGLYFRSVVEFEVQKKRGRRRLDWFGDVLRIRREERRRKSWVGVVEEFTDAEYWQMVQLLQIGEKGGRKAKGEQSDEANQLEEDAFPDGLFWPSVKTVGLLKASFKHCCVEIGYENLARELIGRSVFEDARRMFLKDFVVLGSSAHALNVLLQKRAFTPEMVHRELMALVREKWAEYLVFRDAVAAALLVENQDGSEPEPIVPPEYFVKAAKDLSDDAIDEVTRQIGLDILPYLAHEVRQEIMGFAFIGEMMCRLSPLKLDLVRLNSQDFWGGKVLVDSVDVCVDGVAIDLRSSEGSEAFLCFFRGEWIVLRSFGHSDRWWLLFAPWQPVHRLVVDDDFSVAPTLTFLLQQGWSVWSIRRVPPCRADLPLRTKDRDFLLESLSTPRISPFKPSVTDDDIYVRNVQYRKIGLSSVWRESCLITVPGSFVPLGFKPKKSLPSLANFRPVRYTPVLPEYSILQDDSFLHDSSQLVHVELRFPDEFCRCALKSDYQVLARMLQEFLCTDDGPFTIAELFVVPRSTLATLVVVRRNDEIHTLPQSVILSKRTLKFWSGEGVEDIATGDEIINPFASQVEHSFRVECSYNVHFLCGSLDAYPRRKIGDFLLFCGARCVSEDVIRIRLSNERSPDIRFFRFEACPSVAARISTILPVGLFLTSKVPHSRPVKRLLPLIETTATEWEDWEEEDALGSEQVEELDHVPAEVFRYILSFLCLDDLLFLLMRPLSRDSFVVVVDELVSRRKQLCPFEVQFLGERLLSSPLGLLVLWAHVALDGGPVPACPSADALSSVAFLSNTLPVRDRNLVRVLCHGALSRSIQEKAIWSYLECVFGIHSRGECLQRVDLCFPESPFVVLVAILIAVAGCSDIPLSHTHRSCVKLINSVVEVAVPTLRDELFPSYRLRGSLLHKMAIAATRYNWQKHSINQVQNILRGKLTDIREEREKRAASLKPSNDGMFAIDTLADRTIYLNVTQEELDTPSRMRAEGGEDVFSMQAEEFDPTDFEIVKHDILADRISPSPSSGGKDGRESVSPEPIVIDIGEQDPEGVDTASAAVSSFLCPFCGTPVVDETGFVDHVFSLHLGLGSRSGVCPLCKTWHADLIDHVSSFHLH